MGQKGVWLRSGGGQLRSRAGNKQISNICGGILHKLLSKGGSVPPLLRRGPVSPNAVPKKQKKDVRARHGLQVSSRRFIV